MGCNSFALIIFTVLLVGCGKSMDVAPVKGRVTLDGKPVKFANVTFQVEGRPPGTGRTDEDGHYELIYKRGVMGGPIGKNRVTISEDTELTHGPQRIPARYNTQSELERDVVPGNNEFDFDLKTEGT